ncbi:SWFGD domain-containing protein [Caulobacter sp. 17J65-9]|nr:SWFGD domain-containing protein [Caulobacter sp. 17J65-9]
MNRAGDEVKSWFGDDDAERRRRMDEMREQRDDRGHWERGHWERGGHFRGPDRPW